LIREFLRFCHAFCGCEQLAVITSHAVAHSFKITLGSGKICWSYA
jgi:hypothetical protein